MIGNFESRSGGKRGLAFLLVLSLLAPLLIALPAATGVAAAAGGGAGQQRPGMSTRKKVVLLAGAALVYYLFKKHQARKAEQERTAAAGRTRPGMGTTTTAGNRTPQLYRSRNGGIYYRDAQGKPIWLTAPSRSIQVPADEVQRYAPDYTRYRGPAPSIPSGARRESFENFDSSLFSNTNYNTRSNSGVGGGSMPPGPR